MKPIKDQGNNGLYFLLGHGTNQQKVVAFVRVVNIKGDNEGQDKLSLVSAKCSGGSCRFCECPEILNNKKQFLDPEAFDNNAWPIRDNNVIKDLCKQMLRINLQKIQNMQYKNSHNEMGINHGKMSDDDKKILEVCRQLGLKPGENAFMELEEAVRPTAGIAAMTGPDPMHTVNGGVIKYCINLVMALTWFLTKLNPNVYGHIISVLDSIIKTFPRKQSVLPFKLMHLKDGISKLTPFTRSSKTKRKNTTTNQSSVANETHNNNATSSRKRSNNSSSSSSSQAAPPPPPPPSSILKNPINTSYGGLVVGHIPLEMMPGILYQLVYSIEPLLPEHIELPSTHDIQCGLSDEWPIKKLVYNVCHGALDIVTILKTEDGYTDGDLKKLSTSISGVIAKLFLLQDCVNDVNYAHSKIPIVSRVPIFAENRKPHNMTHIPYFIRWLGTPDVFNTHDGENALIKIKEFYEKSAKNTSLMELSMTNKAIFEENLRLLLFFINLPKNQKIQEQQANNDEKEEVETETDENFSGHSAEKTVLATTLLTLNNIEAAAKAKKRKQASTSASSQLQQQNNTPKEIIIHELGKFQSNKTSDYMHPFLTWQTLTAKLKNYYESGIAASVVKEDALKFKALGIFLKQEKPQKNVEVKMQCLSMISFNKGSNFVPYKLRCHKDGKVNRVVHEVNLKSEAVFSTIDVLFGENVDEEVRDVTWAAQVMTILQLTRTVHDTDTQNSNKCDWILLVVAYLTEEKISVEENYKMNHLHDKVFKYYIDNARTDMANNVTVQKDMSIDIIEIESVIRPTCMLSLHYPNVNRSGVTKKNIHPQLLFSYKPLYIDYQQRHMEAWRFLQIKTSLLPTDKETHWKHLAEFIEPLQNLRENQRQENPRGGRGGSSSSNTNTREQESKLWHSMFNLALGPVALANVQHRFFVCFLEFELILINTYYHGINAGLMSNKTL